MSQSETPPYTMTLIDERKDLADVLKRAAEAKAIALDVEANGLFVYRPRLCAVQLAWEEEDATRVAVLDTLRVDAAALAPLLGPEGPIKVLHDFAFDARILAEHGVPLGRARDTSVAARLLGQNATGLSAVLKEELGVRLDKKFQQHDWARRPFEPEVLRYLGDDVAYLLELDRRLMSKASAVGIEEEIEEEYAYKLRMALAPPKDARPAYVRVKGAQKLDAQGRAVLRRLVDARESIAETLDVPSFKVIPNEALLTLALVRPRTMKEIAQTPAALAGRAGKHVSAWLSAIALGIDDGDVPEAERALFSPVTLSRKEVLRRREIEARIGGFRRAEAKRRGVDEQVVLPGHCAHEVASLLVHAPEGSAADPQAIAAIAGFGAKRAALYAERLAKLLVQHLERKTAEEPLAT